MGHEDQLCLPARPAQPTPAQPAPPLHLPTTPDKFEPAFPSGSPTEYVVHKSADID